MTIRVLVADDHRLVRMGIVHMLEDSDGISVVGEADCGLSAIEAARKLLPDVALLDVNMPNMNGIDATKKIKRLGNIKVIAVSAFDAEPYPSMLLKAGVDGYITKGAPLPEVIAAIYKAHAGGKYFSGDVAEQLAQALLSDARSPFDCLSEREKQVAMMVVDCKSAQQIADALFVSAKTVNTYRYRIFEKLGIDSDVKLVRLAIEHGLIPS